MKIVYEIYTYTIQSIFILMFKLIVFLVAKLYTYCIEG